VGTPCKGKLPQIRRLSLPPYAFMNPFSGFLAVAEFSPGLSRSPWWMIGGFFFSFALHLGVFRRPRRFPGGTRNRYLPKFLATPKQNLATNSFGLQTLGQEIRPCFHLCFFSGSLVHETWPATIFMLFQSLVSAMNNFNKSKNMTQLCPR